MANFLKPPANYRLEVWQRFAEEWAISIPRGPLILKVKIMDRKHQRAWFVHRESFSMSSLVAPQAGKNSKRFLVTNSEHRVSSKHCDIER
jgi:hypothetical protein